VHTLAKARLTRIRTRIRGSLIRIAAKI